MEAAAERSRRYMLLWSGGRRVEVVTFSALYGILGMSRGAAELIRLFSGRAAGRIEEEE
jgi:cobalt-precorrin-5B (C1)-methyltransferase